MTEENKRNILVSSDEIECSMTIWVPGETITMLARQFWKQGSHLRAIQFLMEGVKNIPWNITIGVLEGRLKFVGDPKITIETDDTKGLLTYEQALKASEALLDQPQVQEPNYNPKYGVEQVKRNLPLPKNPKNPKNPKKFMGKTFQELKEESGCADEIKIDPENFLKP